MGAGGQAKAPLVIRGARVIDAAQGFDGVRDVLVREGRVDSVGVLPPDGDYGVLDARGLVLTPGFIDLHCHLREPGDGESETIASGTEAAARGGFTTICCMPNTTPPLDRRSRLKPVLDTACSALARVLPVACVTEDREGAELADLGALRAAGAIAFSDDGSPVGDPDLLRQALAFSCDTRVPVMEHCEELSLSAGGQVNEGEVSRRLGLSGIPAAAEERAVERAIMLAKETGGRLHLCHLSTEGSVRLLRAAKEQGVNVTAEAAPHHLALTEEWVAGQGFDGRERTARVPDTNAKVNPPLRSERDRKALVAALREGVIDAVATDHAPHRAADKAPPFERAKPGISGFETAFGLLVRLVESGEIDLPTLIARLTLGPARVLGPSLPGKLRKLGTLQSGAPADLVIFDPRRAWTVRAADFASKGKNTPLEGCGLRGRVLATLVGGRIVHLDLSLKIAPARAQEVHP